MTIKTTTPELPGCLKSALERGHTLQVEGTNVVRVPFGVRQPRRQRPDRSDTWATLVLPFQVIDSPTPPPQAA
jgi:hypothetical protein